MSSLPLTIQDDLKAKEEYQKQKNEKYCSSRKIRLWSVILLLFTATVLLLNYARPTTTTAAGEEELTLKDEISGLINKHKLIVFSKTYCP